MNLDQITLQDFYSFLEKEGYKAQVERETTVDNDQFFEKWLNLSKKGNLLQDIIIYDRSDLLQPLIEIDSNGVTSCLRSTRTTKRQSVLHLSSSNTSFRVVHFLKNLFESTSENINFINDQTVWGETALHIATGIGNSDIVTILLSMKIDESRTDQWQRTAADIAKETGHETLFETTSLSKLYLTPKENELSTNIPMERNIPRQIISKEFMTALAKKRSNLDATNVVYSSAANTPPSQVKVQHMFSTKFESIVMKEDLSSPSIASPAISTIIPISKLLEYPGDPITLTNLCSQENWCKYDVNGKDMFGLTALHKIVSWDKLDLLEILLAHPHLDVNERAAATHQQFTALHFAIDHQAMNSFQRLLQMDNVQRDLVDSLGRTPLQLATEGNLLPFTELLL